MGGRKNIKEVFMKKITAILSYIMIGILAVCLISAVNLRFIYSAEFKTVLTPSMEPELPVGSMIVILPTEYDRLQKGDDITYVRDESLTLVTRRIVKKYDKTQYLITKGIANDMSDRPVSYKNVVGKVCLCIPLLGYFLIWAKTVWGKITAVVAVTALTTLCLMRHSHKRKNRRSEKNKTKDGISADNNT